MRIEKRSSVLVLCLLSRFSSLCSSRFSLSSVFAFALRVLGLGTEFVFEDVADFPEESANDAGKVDQFGLEHVEPQQTLAEEVVSVERLGFLLQQIEAALQLSLVVLEEVFMARFGPVCKVPKRVGPLQDPPTLDDLLHSFLEKLHFGNIPQTPLQQNPHLLVHLRHLLLRRHPLAVRVGPIPFEEVGISFERFFGLFAFFFAGVGRSLFVDVASVEVAGLVFFPVAEAEPAELEAAAASHVHASLVLLDRLLALWTVFRVDEDPRHVICFALVFQIPALDDVARHWTVRFLAAVQAEPRAARTAHVAALKTPAGATERKGRRRERRRGRRGRRRQGVGLDVSGCSGCSIADVWVVRAFAKRRGRRRQERGSDAHGVLAKKFDGHGAPRRRTPTQRRVSFHQEADLEILEALETLRRQKTPPKRIAHDLATLVQRTPFINGTLRSF